MRTNEARIEAMHKRAAEIERTNRKRKTGMICVASFAVCLIFVIGLALKMPHIIGPSVDNTLQEGMSASVFSVNGAISYIFVSIIAFMLGAAVTVFCYRLRKLSEINRDESENRKYKE